MRDDLKDLVAEALRLNSSMKKDRARLAELKSIILAESQGRNASFKIYTDVGEARFNKRKEKLTYTFDERYFLNLDEETQQVSLGYNNTRRDFTRNPDEFSHGEIASIALSLRLAIQSASSKNGFIFPFIYDDCTEELDNDWVEVLWIDNQQTDFIWDDLLEVVA